MTTFMNGFHTLAGGPPQRYDRPLTPSSRRKPAMSVQDRIEALREKHALLERALDEEIHRPLPNQDTVHDLKRQKLRIKDEIFALERQ
jgi:hypothetical protein